jgi:hypothetical protein
LAAGGTRGGLNPLHITNYFNIITPPAVYSLFIGMKKKVPENAKRVVYLQTLFAGKKRPGKIYRKMIL